MKKSNKTFLLIICLLVIILSLKLSTTSVYAASFAAAQEAAKRISAGLNHSLAVNFDGTVVVWGENTGAGQANAVPAGLSGVQAVSAGYYHNLALGTDGKVVAWGLNDDGQSIVPETAESGIKAIAAGGYHSLALNEDGKVIAWGNNDNGRCNVPEEAESGVSVIAAGGAHSLALKDGKVIAWGNNDNGQCTVPPEALSGVTAIAAGGAHSLALKSDGTVVAWGANGAWQCAVPADLSNVVAIAAGNDFSMALTSDTTKVTAWGNLSEPASNRDFGAITAGGLHAIAVNYYQDVLQAWGNNNFGQCTIPQAVKLIGDVAACALEDEEITLGSSDYKKDVDYSADTINITVTLENTNQAVYIVKDGFADTKKYPESGTSVPMPLTVGNNKIIIRVYLPVIGESIHHQYVLQITRAAADVDLKTLKTSVGTRKEAFAPEVTNYTINVDQDVAGMDITAITNNPEASVSIGGKSPEVETQIAEVPLAYGENAVDILVSKGEESKTYTLNIIKGGFLEALTINNGMLSSAFEYDTFNYMVDVNSTTSFLEITPSLKDPTHELWINGTPHPSGETKTITLSEDKHQEIKLEVKIPDTAVTRTYTLYVNRVTKDDFIGSGTIEDPYLIFNLPALQEIAYDNTLLDKYFQLVCDLDASTTVNWHNGAGFLPVGSPTNKFTGCFEGAGHTISNLNIARPELDYVGLFGYSDGGEIRNLGLANCQVQGKNKVGALFGESCNTYIENCYSTGTVSGTSAVGGLGGSSSGDYLTGYHLANCISRAAVGGTTDVGGLIGKLDSGWLNYCYATGLVQGTGGLVGALGDAENCHETYCYWDLDTSGKASSFLGSGKTSAAMKEQTTYLDWNFTSIWAIDAETNGGYPYLQIFQDTLSPVVDSSLILWLDGRHGSNDARTSIWQDLSGKGNHGALKNVDFNESSGWIGELLRLDGVNDQISIPQLNYDQDFTLEILFSLNNFATFSDIITDNSFRIFHRGWYDELFFLLKIKEPKAFAGSSWAGSAGFSNNYIPLKTIVNFAFIKKGNVISIYRDGVLARSVDVVSGLNKENDLTLNTEVKSLLKINGNSMSSDLYNIRFYDRALTAAEVAQNYHAEQPRIKAMTAANLAELTVTPGVISPAFKASTLNYTVLLEDRAVESVNITATALGADATVMIDGEALGTGTQSIDIDVSSGTKEVPIVVTEADGVTTKTYKIRIIKPGYLTGLFVDGKSVTGFISDTLDYTVDVAYSETPVNISATLEDLGTQSLLINNQLCTSGHAMPVSLNVGLNTIPIKVVVPGKETTYTLNIRRAALVDLQALSLNQGALDPAFAPAVTGYTVTLDEPLDSIQITATSADPGAIVTINGEEGGAGAQSAPAALTLGNNSINVVVTGIDGLTEKTYTVNVIRPAYLTALTVKNMEEQALALSPEFTSTIFEYILPAVEHHVTSLNITAIGENATSVLINDLSPIDNARDISLEVGANTITLKVAPNSEPDLINTYTITVYREPSVNLSSLTSSAGTLNPTFDADTTDYTITLDQPLANLDLTVTPADLNATVTLLQPVIDDSPTQAGTRTINVPLQARNNEIALMVQGTDGVTTKTYNVEVKRPAALTNLFINQGTLTPEYDATTQTYTATVDDRTASIKVVVSVEEGAELYINGDLQTSGEEKTIALEIGTNEITIETVISGLSYSYSLTVTRAASDVRLDGLSTNTGEWDKAFTPETMDYTVTLDTLADAIEITATPADPEATVKINGDGTGAGAQTAAVAITAGENIIPISITGWDGVTTGAYSLTVLRPGCLTDLTVSDSTLNMQELLPSFDPETISYTVNVPNQMSQVDITAVLENGGTQQLRLNDEIVSSGTPKTISLAIGPNPLTLEVIMPGISRTYLLTVNRAMSEKGNADLWQLSTDAGEITPLFDPALTAYTVNIAEATDNLTITAVPFDSAATVLIKGEGTGTGGQSVNVSLDAGDNLIPIIVRARDESTTKTYTLKVIRGSSSNANLQALAVDRGTLTPDFNPPTATYKVESGVELNTLGITAATADSSAAITINGEAVANNVPLTVKLDQGGNLIPIVVTAADETTQKAYIVSVNGKVSNGDLESLTVKAVKESEPENPQTLDLDFAAAETSYQLRVARTVTGLELTAAPADSKALMLLNETLLPAGEHCQVSLAEGENVLRLTVVAQDVSTKVYTIQVVRNGLLAISTNSLPIGLLGTAYTCQLTATGGNAPYSWSATGLPAGFTLNPSTGEISGLPKKGGIYEIAITVTDQEGEQVTENLTLRLNLGSGNSGYLLTPVNNPVYTIGNSPEGFPLLTIKKGYSGFYFFSVNITPVQEHPGKETLLFTHLRKGSTLQTNAVTADYDQLANTQTGFNVLPEDVIMVRMVNG